MCTVSALFDIIVPFFFFAPPPPNENTFRRPCPRLKRVEVIVLAKLG